MTTVRGFSSQVKVTPTTSGAYSSGDQLGVTGSTTYIEIPKAASIAGGVSYLKSIDVVNEGTAQAAIIEFNFYSGIITGVADNAAWSVSPADEALYWQGRLVTTSSNWTARSAHEVGEIDGALKMLKCAANRSLYCTIRIVSGTPTFANGNFNLTFNFVQD